MKRNLESTVYFNPYANRVELRLADRGIHAAAVPATFEPIEDGAEWPPLLSITRIEAQAIFDEFCRAGFKPSHQVDAASALQATREHLADMRKIAFNGLRAAGIQPNAQAVIDDGLEAWAKGGDA